MRQLVSEFHDEVLLGASRRSAASRHASQLAMAAHELVENAMAHGPGGETSFSISIEPSAEGAADRYVVCMKTRNRAEPRDQQLARQLVQALAAADDPLQFYLGLMAETARRPQGSGLGLARVRVEADMDVSCVVEGDQLEIVARVQYPHEARAGHEEPS